MAGLQTPSSRLGLATLAAGFALLAIAHPRASLAQAMGEYGRAGTQVHTSSRSPVPRVPKAAPAGSSTTEGAHLIRAKHAAESGHGSHPQGPPLWTETWFSNRALVRGQIQAMVEAITASMIGERYPLPRGGGFRCTQPGGRGDPDAPPWAMRCVGTDVGSQRENDFSVVAPGTAPVLERVRWIVVAPAPTHSEAWRPFCAELTDSITRVMGSPSWTASDHSGARWNWNGAETTLRFHGVAAHSESLEVTCLSDRLAEPRRSAAP